MKPPLTRVFTHGYHRYGTCDAPTPPPWEAPPPPTPGGYPTPTHGWVRVWVGPCLRVWVGPLHTWAMRMAMAMPRAKAWGSWAWGWGTPPLDGMGLCPTSHTMGIVMRSAQRMRACEALCASVTYETLDLGNGTGKGSTCLRSAHSASQRQFWALTPRACVKDHDHQRFLLENVPTRCWVDTLVVPYEPGLQADPAERTDEAEPRQSPSHAHTVTHRSRQSPQAARQRDAHSSVPVSSARHSREPRSGVPTLACQDHDHLRAPGHDHDHHRPPEGGTGGYVFRPGRTAAPAVVTSHHPIPVKYRKRSAQSGDLDVER